MSYLEAVQVMNRFWNIAVAIAITGFIATNCYLLFGEKSTFYQSVAVNEFERMKTGDFSEQLPKESLVVPEEIYTVYVEQEDSVTDWLVKEGDVVIVGQELATLNTDRADKHREMLEVEFDALTEQEIELFNILTNLENSNRATKQTKSPNVKTNEGIRELNGTTTLNLGIDANFQVDVSQEGAYTAAISAVEQQLSEVQRKILVAETQLAQGVTNASLVSPADGVVSKVHRMGSRLAVDIYGSQRQVITYAKDDEWQEIQSGAKVLFEGSGIEKDEQGTVLSIAPVFSDDNKLLETYKSLDEKESLNPLAYYEVRIAPDNQLDTLPFAHNIHAMIYTNEVFGAVAMNKDWLRKKKEETAETTILTESGQASPVTIETPFIWEDRAVVTMGVSEGDIVIHKSLKGYDYTPRVFMPMPHYKPTKQQLKSYGWKNYLRHMIVR